jgi:predicted dehydrogenase
MSDKIRVGVIGAGSIARGSHIPALKKHPDVEISAICDANESALHMVAREFGIDRAFTDYDELLSMDDLDAVHVCTPNYLHMDPTVKALKSGKHVLVEKPIARNSVEGAAMVEAARAAGKKLMVAYCWRWHSGARALRRFIEAGDLGEIYYARVHALRRRGIPNWGDFTDKARQGGGPLVDIGCHLLDLTLWLMGHPKPVSASGKCYTKFGNRPDLVNMRGPWDHTRYTVEDFAVGLIRFEDGATLSIESSFAANIEKDTSNTVLLGTEGGCELNPLRIYREERQTLVDMTPVALPEINWREAEIFEFIDAIRDDKPVPIPGEEGLTVSKILDAMYKSSDENREVEIL